MKSRPYARAVLDRPTTVTIDLSDQATPPTAVDVRVEREDGTELVASTAASVDAGIASYDLAAQDEEDVLLFEWSPSDGDTAGATFRTYLEIAGARYAELGELRGLTNLSDTAKVTDDDLELAEWWAEKIIERGIGYAAVPRYARDVLDGDGSDTLILRRWPIRRVLSATIDGTAVTVSDLAAYEDGELYHSTGTFTKDRRNVEVRYAHGMIFPPEELRHAALELTRHLLLDVRRGKLPDRATMLSTDLGTISLAQPDGDRRITGVPQVDSVIRSARRRVPAIG